MSVISVTPDLVEVTTLLLQPSQSFASSSSGLTGSIRLATKPTNFLKFVASAGSGSYFTETLGITADSDLLYSASTSYAAGITDISGLILGYIDEVQTSEVERSQFSTVYPQSFFSPGDVQSYSYDSTTGEVSVPFDSNEWKNNQRRLIRNLLIPGQRVENPLSFYGYTNYNCLNFISSSNFGTGSAIIYPNFSGSDGSRDYSMSGSFTLDFFIKPKAPLDEIEAYNAGTIFHISSSICVSLISGSQLSPDRKPETYRILLQLSQSADLSPSSVSVSSLPLSYPNDLIFASDEILKRDCWHRVTIRWGTNSRSYGTGSILIDETTNQFVADLETIQSKAAFISSDALILGNYYNSGDRVGKFFNLLSAAGTELDPDSSSADPSNFKFVNPLNAELHHISLFNRYLADNELEDINSYYLKTVENNGPTFFVPPFFTSSVEEFYGYLSPSDLRSIGPETPISYFLAAGYNSNFLSLQNFIIDFSQKKQPRPYGMTPVSGESTLTLVDSRTESVDDIMMSLMSNRRRNFTILPCDDGNFEPDFSILESDDTRFQYLDHNRIPSMISLEHLVPSGAFYAGVHFEVGLNYDGTDYPYLPLFQNVNYLSETSLDVDRSSNIVTVFSIPAAYYLNRIIPGTFTITDANVSGSGGMSFTLKDDGRGNLYRSDTKTTPAMWNRAGAIFYSQGIAAILTPHLPFFGKNSFEMSFRGEVRKSVVSYTIPASPSFINDSFNQTYKSFPPTNSRTETADEFVYIDGINLHDSNFNVVMRARLAQPVQKREGDEIVFRIRYDF